MLALPLWMSCEANNYSSQQRVKGEETEEEEAPVLEKRRGCKLSP